MLVVGLTVSSRTQAQSQILRGQVLDRETRQPIRNTAVFVSGTTIGSTSDSLGHFSLKLPYAPCILIADHVAYDAFVSPVESGGQVILELQPSVYGLTEVSVSGKNKRKRNLRFFYAHFNTENQSKISILNDSVLVFDRDEMSFRAYTKEPLVIENRVLGYRITALIEEFKVTALDAPGGQAIPLISRRGGEVTQLNGYFFYEPLDGGNPQQDAKYRANRREAYYGSYRHFLKALYNENLAGQGYQVQAFPADSTIFYPADEPDLTSFDKAYRFTADSLKVFYYFDDHHYPVPESRMEDRFYVNQRTSMIYPTPEPFVVRMNGTSPRLTFIIRGGMRVRNFANSLPEDYQPDNAQ